MLRSYVQWLGKFSMMPRVKHRFIMYFVPARVEVRPESSGAREENTTAKFFKTGKI